MNEKQIDIIVTRNGFIDDEHYDNIYAEKRRQALEQAGKQLVQSMCTAGRNIGRAALYVLTPEPLRH